MQMHTTLARPLKPSMMLIALATPLTAKAVNITAKGIKPSNQSSGGKPVFSGGMISFDWNRPRVTLGTNAKMTFAAFREDIVVGRVIAIAAHPDPAGAVAVEIALPDDARLKVGQAGTASIIASGTSTRLLAVPPSAVCARQGTMAQVYVVDLATSRVHLRRITLGDETPAGIGVLSGLALGEWVALSRAGTLKDGMKIAPIGPQ